MPFSLYHYLAVVSAASVNPGYEIVVHYGYEPGNNEWWERCRKISKVSKIGFIPLDFHGTPIKQYAHKTDWIRLDILSAEGGIYLDMDTVCISPFDPLLGLPRRCVMGLELWNGELTGLCNAVILAEKQHPFLSLWKDTFIDFNPDDWNKMACRKPLEVYLKDKALVHIEPPSSFFPLTWSKQDLWDMHRNVVSLSKSYSAHLWESKSYREYLQPITEQDVLGRDSTYNLLVRKPLLSLG